MQFAPILLVLGAIPFAIWQIVLFKLDLRRRSVAGACRHCGYDRSALHDGMPCPECGHNTLGNRHRPRLPRTWGVAYVAFAVLCGAGVSMGNLVLACILAPVYCLPFLIVHGLADWLRIARNPRAPSRAMAVGCCLVAAAMLVVGTIGMASRDALTAGFSAMILVPIAGFAAALWTIPVAVFLARR